MISYNLDIDASIDLAQTRAYINQVRYESKLFSISTSMCIQFIQSPNPALLNIQIHVDRKLHKQELTEVLKEQFKRKPQISSAQAQTLAKQVTQYLEENHPKVLKKSWGTYLSRAYNQITTSFSNSINWICDFKLRNLYIPRRYLDSPTWGGIFFRLIMAGGMGTLTVSIAFAAGTSPLVVSMGALASSFLGYTGLAYMFQRVFYGEKLSFFDINPETRTTIETGFTMSGGASKKPYLRSVAGVEQDLIHLLADRHHKDNSPEGLAIQSNVKLLARYHAYQAANLYPDSFYKNEIPKQAQIDTLAQKVQNKLPFYLVR